MFCSCVLVACVVYFGRVVYFGLFFFEFTPRKYTNKIRQLRAMSKANDQLVVRAINPRPGMAGRTPKFETWFVDEGKAKGVLLMEAFGMKQVKRASSIEEGKLYTIKKYTIVAANKSLTYASSPIKMTMDDSTLIEPVLSNEISEYASMPTILPCYELSEIINMTASCVLSLKALVKKPGTAIPRETRQGSKKVTNFTIMAGKFDIEVATWGPLAEEMSGQPQDSAFAFFGILAQKTGDSMKLTSIERTQIVRLSDEEKRELLDNLPEDQKTAPMTQQTAGRGPSRMELLAQKCPVHTVKDVRMLSAVQYEALAGEQQDPRRVVEIAGINVEVVRGASFETPQEVAYTACATCLKKVEESSGRCVKCNSDKPVQTKRYIAHFTLSDPTCHCDCVAYHECVEQIVEDFQISLKDGGSLLVSDLNASLQAVPLVARVHVKQESVSRNPGVLHVELLCVKKAIDTRGILNVFRCPKAYDKNDDDDEDDHDQQLLNRWAIIRGLLDSH